VYSGPTVAGSNQFCACVDRRCDGCMRLSREGSEMLHVCMTHSWWHCGRQSTESNSEKNSKEGASGGGGRFHVHSSVVSPHRNVFIKKSTTATSISESNRSATASHCDFRCTHFIPVSVSVHSIGYKQWKTPVVRMT